MRPGVLTLLLIIGGLCALPAPAAPPAKPSFESINALVARLGSGKFKERQAATRELDALGAAALDSLRTAAADPDAEVRRRATALADRIEKRIETAQILTPTRFRFVCKDKPVVDAVAEFSRRTGFAVQIDPAGRTVLGSRRVTVDTGSTTFWDAFEKFCAKAGLVEAAPKTKPQPMNPYGNGMFVTSYYNPYGRTVSGPMMLEAGKPEHIPTCLAGAVRVKVLSTRIPLLGHARDEGETLFGLEVDHEPQMQWQGVVGMRILKAIDDHGINLPQPNLYVGESASNPYEAMGMVVWSMDGSYSQPQPKDPRQVPVHLRLPRYRSKKLRQLSGVVSAQVVSPPMPLITVHDVLRAAGRTINGPDGHLIKVIDAKRQLNGQVRIQVRIDTRRPNFGGGPAMMVMGGGMMAMESSPSSAGPGNLALKDAQGRSFPLVKVEKQNWLPSPSGTSQESTLVYQAPRNQAEALKLVYTGTRSLVIDVPFTLKDVALP
ncbi:MAG TPA: HEAT repeat domain-containing protein [Gemmataceae bacterium]|jgi:hypothetical protein|nr:HEAT repeat domain-containing protein [Gemmataceae bacterium]